jgi:hypothetical protein
MATTTDELRSFYQFAETRLRNGGCDQSLDDLYAEWRAGNPTPTELEGDVRAVRASLRDMDEGETGRPVSDFIAEFRQRNGL